MCVYIYIYTHVYIYIYIYIYMGGIWNGKNCVLETARWPKRQSETESWKRKRTIPPPVI